MNLLSNLPQLVVNQSQRQGQDQPSTSSAYNVMPEPALSVIHSDPSVCDHDRPLEVPLSADPQFSEDAESEDDNQSLFGTDILKEAFERAVDVRYGQL